MKKLLLLPFILLMTIGLVSAIEAADTSQYFTMDDAESNATQILDLVGTYGNANISGTTSGATGVIGEAHNFGNDGDFLVLEGDQDLGTANWSISAWIKTTKSGAFIYYDGGAGGGISTTLQVGNVNSKIFMFIDGSTADCSFNDGSDVATGSYVFIVLTIDQTNGIARLYVDGVFDTSCSATFGNTRNQVNPILIGKHANNAAQSFFDGEIDEYGIHSKTLTQADITALYNSGAGLQYSYTNDLTVDWDSESPLDTETRADDPLNFSYIIADVDTSATCTLFSNKTGTFDSNEDSTGGLSDGTFELSYSPGVNETQDLTFQINCTDSSLTSSSSVKNIEIDTKNVVITYIDPLSDGTTTYNENDGLADIEIRFSNHNLDYVNYTVTYPNGSIAQTNVSTVFSDPLNFVFEDTITFTTSETGVWTVTAYGNDTQGLESTRVTTFEVLDVDLTVEWDSNTPFNNTALVDILAQAYPYELTLQNISTTTCTMFVDDTFLTSNVETTSGTKSFNLGYPVETSEVHDYHINCTSLSGYLGSETSVKHITINNALTENQLAGLLAIIPLMVMIGTFVMIVNNRKKILG